jgi:hypothetical protein
MEIAAAAAGLADSRYRFSLFSPASTNRSSAYLVGRLGGQAPIGQALGSRYRRATVTPTLSLCGRA